MESSAVSAAPPAPVRAGESLDERRLHVAAAFATSLRVQIAIVLLVVAGIVAGAGWDWRVAAAWAVLAIVLREARTSALQRLVRAVDMPIEKRLRAAVWWGVLPGLCHGAGAVFMVRMDAASDAFITMILLSLAAGSASTAYAVARMCTAYLVCVIGPVALAWALGGTWQDLAIAALVILYLFVQLRFAGQNRRMLEDAFRMRLQNNDLLDKLSLEREAMAQARDAAVRADLSKSRFLAAASHDLRQPLQSLTLNSGALARMPLDSASRAVAQEMATEIDALRQMLDGLLDISQLDAGAAKPRLQKIPVRLFLESVCVGFQPSAAAKGLRLSFTSPPDLVMASDVDMLRRVLSNLLDNALKFTTAGEIQVAARQAEGAIRMTVRDTGVGIDVTDQERVFEDLVQLRNPQRDRRHGHGLGLGIVRRLVHVLGIGYSVESRIGQGTTVLLEIPDATSDVPVVSARADDSRPGLVARQVLVVDDDAAVRRAYEHALSSLHCLVRSVATMDEALELVRRQSIEVVIVDYRLGDTNGLDGILRLRELNARLPAILVSADASVAMRADAARLGVPCLRKPVTDAMLATAINAAVLGTGMPDQLARQSPLRDSSSVGGPSGPSESHFEAEPGGASQKPW